MPDRPKLKDYFDAELVRGIGRRIAQVKPFFDVERLVTTAVGDDWEQLSLTERSRRIAAAMWETLDVGVVDALDVVVRILPEELDDSEGVLNNGFWMWPLGDFIATYAVDHPGPALDCAEALTKRFTAEFAIRPFLARYPETMDRVEQWADDPNEHVRRLASEGTRARLPWAARLDLPIDRVIGVLAALRRDESRYVRRSVANHLNDLAKGDSDRIVALLEEWHAEGVPETSWIVRHALRNHLKDGDERVMKLFGYAPAQVDVVGLKATPDVVAIGESTWVEFAITDRAGRDQKLMIDLVVGYVKSNGSVTAKVFKFMDFALPADATRSCRRKLDMVTRSTRKLYPGRHSVTVRANGTDVATTTFELTG